MTQDIDAPPELVWGLIARPDRWRRWAPHLRGAWGLGDEEIEPGARGAVRLLGFVPIPARITAKQDGEAWVWRVGVVDVEHRVEAVDGGCRVTFVLRAPLPLRSALRTTYGPVMALLGRNLARVAERDARSRRPHERSGS